MIGYSTKNKIIYVIQLVFIIAISVSGVIYTRKYCDMQQGMCMYSYMDIYINSVCTDINVIAASQIFLIIYLINMDYILSPNIIVRLNERENVLWRILRSGAVESLLYGIISLIVCVLTGTLMKEQYSSGRICNYDMLNSIYYMFTGKTDAHISLAVLRIAAILICSIFLRYIIGIIVSLIVRKKSYILVISIIINVLLSVRHIFNINGETQYFIYKIYTDTTESLIALSVMMIVIVVCIISAKILIGKKDWI